MWRRLCEQSVALQHMLDKHGLWKFDSSLGRLDFPAHVLPKLEEMRKSYQYVLKISSDLFPTNTGVHTFSPVQLGHPPQAPGADVSPNPADAWPEVHGCHI